MDQVDENDILSKPVVKLNSGLSMAKLLSDEGASFEINFADLKEHLEDDIVAYKDEDILPYTNMDCLGLQDDETYDDAEPFEKLGEKMTNLLESGKVKKRIIREGVGSVLPKQGFVICDYNAYVEYSAEPFDSTYAQKKPFKFRLGSPSVLPGFDIAVESMKISEKSQFLVHPDLAYKAMGSITRVPPNAWILFEIEVKNCQDTGACVSYPSLTEDKQKNFSEIYNYANALCLKGNSLYSRNLFKHAVVEYNSAAKMLQTCILADYNEQEQQQLLLLRIYSNLVVTYTKLKEPRKACINCNEIYHMVKDTALKVPTKVYFNNARSLMMLGDFDMAEKRLKIARRMEPNNITISEELIKLNQLKKESYSREVALAKHMFKNNKNTSGSGTAENVSSKFQEALTEFFKELQDSAEITQYALPPDLNGEELNYIESEAKKFGLELSKHNDKYFINKVTEKKK